MKLKNNVVIIKVVRVWVVMMQDIFDIIKGINIKEEITLHEILARFSVNSFKELIEEIIKGFDDHIKKDNINQEFFNELYYFILLVLIKKTDDKDDVISLNVLYKALRDIFKRELKDYNKKIKEKDQRYFVLYSLNNKYKGMEIYIDEKLMKQSGDNRFEILWFMIKDLNNPDYLFRIWELHPEYVNLRDAKNKHLFCYICEYFLANMDDLGEEEIKFFKRVIVMMLESDRLLLTNNELLSLLKSCEDYKKSSSTDNLMHIAFISNEIDRHYEVINKDSRLNCVDYCFRDCPLVFVKRSNKTRIDLRSDFVFSIDSMRGKNMQNRLFDDAFSYRDNHNGTYTLFMHIPDVDYYIKKDSPTDLYMRSIGESVYAKGYQKPMLDFEAAKMCSLKQGEDKPAITFAITVDKNGSLIDVDFYKSIIRVNYNLSITMADVFMIHPSDERFKVLKSMRELLIAICKKRKATIGKRSASTFIMDEMNIVADLATASYFESEGIIFPYKNFAGVRSPKSASDVLKCDEFAKLHELSPDDLTLLYSIFDINNRVYYDTVNHGNTEFNGRAIGNVGNPLRQYISLETNRLIKDVVISGEKNIDFWLERIERDCIEYTETSAKIRQLYGRK